MIHSDGLCRAFVGIAPVLIGIIFAASLSAVLLSSGDTLGYDTKAYIAAGRHILDGNPLYDSRLTVAGPFGLFLYPPPFAIGFVPFALLPEIAAIWLWIGILTAAFLAGVALLPVSRGVRWAIVLLAALQWPFLYTMKLGQVTPILWLAFAAGWRAIDRPSILGGSIAVGTLIKVQPALLGLWAIASRRWRAVAWSIALAVVVVIITLPFTGVGAWPDFFTTLFRVSNAVTTPHSDAPGAIAFGAGASAAVSTVIEWAWITIVVALSIFAWFRRDPGTAYVMTVIASQAISPLLWEHYAMILLLPVALLLERRQWWAAVIPLVTWLSLAFVYPIAFAAPLSSLALLSPRATSEGTHGQRLGDTSTYR